MSKGIKWIDIKAELLQDEEFKSEYEILQSKNDFSELKKCELLFDALIVQEEIYKNRRDNINEY